MGISAELEQRIEAEKAAITGSDIRRSGHTASDFADILTQLFANAKSDQQQLIAAGMSAAYLDYCDALLQKLSTLFEVYGLMQCMVYCYPSGIYKESFPIRNWDGIVVPLSNTMQYPT
jgi:hypothetical protein